MTNAIAVTTHAPHAPAQVEEHEDFNVPRSPGQPLSPLGGVEVAVQWRNISYQVGDKEILRGLSGTMRPRRALAIMGSTGAGKTTFLNAVSDRLANDQTHVVGGDVTLNGVPYEHKWRRLIGFVPQDDILLPHATPEEVFAFSLRIRRGTDHKETAYRVDELLEELKLTGSRSTHVGNPGLEVGLSGGERKRANIGVELICDPKVLMLDEPTSGLDSVTAETVIKQLQDLSRRGRTVAYTIHQPTSDCFALFDDVMLMVAGKIVYHGPAQEAVDYFSTIGYDCPDHYTPSDYFMQLMQDEDIGSRLVELWDEHLEKITKSGKLSSNPYLCEPDVENTHLTLRYLEGYQTPGASYKIQAEELAKRSFRSVIRNKMYIMATLVQSAIFALIVTLIFVNLEDTVTGIADRQGMLFMIAINTGFTTIMGMVNSFPPERAVYVREQQTASYSPLIYFCTKSLSELPVQVLACLVASVIEYFPTRLALNGEAFITFVLVILMMSQVGVGIGFVISVGIENYQLASGLTPVIVIPMMLAGGLMASTDRLRPAWYWLEKISFLRHGFVLLERNEFERLGSISCDAAELTADFCSRQPTNGLQVLDSQEFRDGHHEKWLMWLCLAIMLVVPRLVAIGLLYAIGRRKN